MLNIHTDTLTARQLYCLGPLLPGHRVDTHDHTIAVNPAECPHPRGPHRLAQRHRAGLLVRRDRRPRGAPPHLEGSSRAFVLMRPRARPSRRHRRAVGRRAFPMSHVPDRGPHLVRALHPVRSGPLLCPALRRGTARAHRARGRSPYACPVAPPSPGVLTRPSTSTAPRSNTAMRDFIDIAVRAGLVLAAVFVAAVTIDAAVHPATAATILAICVFIAVDASRGT